MSNIDDIIGKFNKAHGDRYDYSKFEYKGDRISSTIICPAHGEFQQIPNVHAKGHGCPSCSKNKRLTTDEFIKSASNRHPNYIYDFVNYKNMHSKVKIVCPSHGEFQQIPLHHLKGVGCPKCNQSKGEKLIESFLLSNGIKFTPQKKFDDCKNINHLIFDFYLTEYNTCIEFNGIQHYYPIDIFGGQKALIYNKKRDNIKQEYCLSKGIELIVIKQDKKHINTTEVQLEIDMMLSKFIV